MTIFLRPWLIRHIGNAEGWKKKLEHVKTKYTNASDPIEDGAQKEFKLWKKIWGNERGDDGDQSGGNEGGWKTKLERVKVRFTKANDWIENGERKEFELWKKIWGNKRQ
ncbi:hypothetical protein L6452_28691 [Arctium lappa]|uniref:Uncharacterized protein n=1 Tax=Arctium lappa TaxID=4217 RepID=A0ACB8ZY75_ARCLA|nr:hypothetical protein L6452_28691 [Arctium lappa]